jgi:AbrB family looped-hinge helix DNA binding protein
MSTNLTSKGQVTIPKKLRDYLGLKSGAPVEFELAPDGRVVVRGAVSASKPRSRFAKVRGSATLKLSTEEIMAMTRGRQRK